VRCERRLALGDIVNYNTYSHGKLFFEPPVWWARTVHFRLQKRVGALASRQLARRRLAAGGYQANIWSLAAPGQTPRVLEFCRRSRLEIVAPGFNRGGSRSPPGLQARFSGRPIPRCIRPGRSHLLFRPLKRARNLGRPRNPRLKPGATISRRLRRRLEIGRYDAAIAANSPAKRQ